MVGLREVNLKQGMPTVSDAKRRITDEIALARRQGANCLKVIHGYGSSGEGGAIRKALRQSLSQRQREGKIKAYLGGERWNIFDESARRFLDQCPELSRDSDLNGHNAGVTFILL